MEARAQATRASKLISTNVVGGYEALLNVSQRCVGRGRRKKEDCINSKERRTEKREEACVDIIASERIGEATDTRRRAL